MSLNILIAEDDALLRNFLIARLSSESGYVISGTAADGRKALEQVERLRPDLLLLDLHLPEISGLQVLERLARLETRPRVLVVSGDEGEATLLEAARHGAHGFLAKSEAISS